jgi:CheY-like chemotaxis protein
MDRDAVVDPLVLLVEDDADGREMYATYLRLADVRVEQAGTGLEALEKARLLRPAALVTDLTMTGFGGVELIAKVRSEPDLRDTAVIVLTGHGDEGHRTKALEAGCNSFLLKPCPPDALLLELQRWIRVGPQMA